MTSQLLQPIRKPPIESHPSIQSDALAIYISDRLRAGTIDLHSAFQLHHETVRIRRLGYRQPAWNHRLSIGELYELFMHGLTAKAVGCIDQFLIVSNWFAQDIPLLQEKRPHHFASKLHRGETLFEQVSFLQELSRIREEYDVLPDDDGPYHVEQFPYHFAAPERELLHPGSCPEFDRSIPLDSEVEELIVELLSGVWST